MIEVEPGDARTITDVRVFHKSSFPILRSAQLFVPTFMTRLIGSTENQPKQQVSRPTNPLTTHDDD